MEDITTANRFPACTGRIVDVIHFHNLYRFHVAIFFERNLDTGNIAPPVRSTSQLGDRLGFDDQIRLTGSPFEAVIKYQRLRRICLIAFRSAITSPLRDRCKLFIAQRRVVLVVSNAYIFFHVPGRHGSGAIAQGCLVLNQTGKWCYLLIGDQRHRRDTTRPVAVLAATLQNRFDVSVERYVSFLRQHGCGDEAWQQAACKH